MLSVKLPIIEILFMPKYTLYKSLLDLLKLRRAGDELDRRDAQSADDEFHQNVCENDGQDGGKRQRAEKGNETKDNAVDNK